MIKKNLAVLILSGMAALPVVAADSDVLFSYEGKDYRLNQLQPWFQQSFYDAKLEAREQQNRLLEQAMVDMYIEKQAAKSGKTVDDLREELFKVDAVSTEEIQALYDQFKDRIGRPLEEVESGLRQELQGRKQQQVIGALIEKVKRETKFVSKLPEPEAPALSMDLTPYPWKGGENAAVTIVEFADYNCGYCRRAKPEIDKIVKEYGNKIKMVYIDFPVTERGVAGVSTQTGRGAFCAGQQDKFWEFNDLAYEKAVTMDNPASFAKTLKLDMKKFNTCLASDESKKFVENSTKMATELGVTGTPTIFVNGQKLQVSDVGKDLKAAIDKTLSTR